MILSHKIQLRPRPKHLVEFNKACGVARYAWNWGLAKWKEEYELGNSPTANKIKKQWNVEKPAWVYESPKDANQQPFTHLGTAFSKFFKNQSRYPKFKSKGVRDSFYVSNDKFKVNNKAVRLPKIGWVRMCEKLRFTGKIMSATVSREADRWFISIQVDTSVEPKHGQETLGVDLGIKDAVVLSDGTKLSGPKPLRKHLTKLKRLQKQHSRKQKGSSNRKKSQLKLQRLHRKISNQRKDFLHKTTSMIVSRAKTIVIEDLNVSGMLKNHKLARALSDIGFFEFRRQLEYKCKLHGLELIIADRWFPSTKLCPACGTLNDMPLNQRTYRCQCGYVADRDIHAASNLRTLGLRGINACRHGSSGQSLIGETTVVEARTTPSAAIRCRV